MHVVWERYDPSTQKNSVFYCRSVNNGISWEPAINLSFIHDYTAWGGAEATPVIAGYMANTAVVIWKYGIPSAGWLAAQVEPAQNSVQELLPGTDGNYQLPSLSTQGGYYHLAYTDGNSIYYKQFSLNGYSISGLTNALQVSSSPSSTNPCIASSYGGEVAIVWDGLNGSDRRVYFKGKDAYGNWLPLMGFSHNTHQLTKPQVVFDYNTNPDKVIFLWQCDSHIGGASLDLPGGLLSSVKDFGSGIGPVLPTVIGAGTQPLSLWLTESSAPYNINITSPEIQSVSGTISNNTTWGGVIDVVDNVTVSSGATLTILPGTVVSFADGKSLVLNGVLNAIGTSGERITFTSATGTSSGSWGYITINGSGASTSTIRYSDILYGTRIDVIDATNIIINNCNILETDWGIHYYSSAGTIQKNVLTSPSIKHGIVIENGSTVYSYENTITKIDNMRRGVGILYGGGSDGCIWRNDIYGWNWGIGAIWGTSPDFSSPYGGPGTRNNRVRNCDYGVMVYNNSFPVIGLPYPSPYTGNAIYENTKNIGLNISYSTVSTLDAYHVYWYIPSPSYFAIGPGSSINYIPYFTTNPWAGIPKIASGDSQTPTIDDNNSAPWIINENFDDKNSLYYATELRFQNRFIEAKDFVLSYIDKNPDDQAAYVELYKCFNDETADDIIKFFNSLPRKAVTGHKLLLSYMYLKKGDIELAKKVNNNLILSEANTPISTRAKINNLYIALHNENDFNSAVSMFNEVLQEYNLSSYVELSLVQDELDTYAQLNGIAFKRAIIPEDGYYNILKSIPGNYALLGNYPNPFNPSTTISYALPYQSDVEIIVYDILGREVRSFVIPTQSAGYQNVLWDGRNENGVQVSSGIYLYRLNIKSLENNEVFVKTAKLMMLK